MLGAFNTLHTNLKSFFSRTFWLSTFLPVAIFAVAHGIVATYALKTKIKLFGVTFGFDQPIDEKSAAAAGTVLLGLVIVGYTISPMLPRIRGWLDGSQLHPALHNFFRKRRILTGRRDLMRVDTAHAELGRFQDLRTSYEAGAFRNAYTAALNTVPQIAQMPAANEAATTLVSARTALDALQAKFPAPNASDIETAERLVIAVLRIFNPDPDALEGLLAGQKPTYEQFHGATEAQKLAEDYAELLAVGEREAVYFDRILSSRYRLRRALEFPQATQIGDARFVTEQYAYDVYRVEFDYLWPRLLVAMRAEKSDEPLLESIENARANVDFAIMSLVLAVSVPAVWLPVMFARGGREWPFFLLGAATPVVLGLLYKLVFEAQLAFGEVAKTAIDRSRFLVLKMLRQADPPTRAAERALWERIKASEEDGRTTTLIYSTPAVSK